MAEAVARPAPSLAGRVVGSRPFKAAVFAGCLYPGADLAWRLWRFFGAGDFNALGVNPAETVLHDTGITALAILLATLSITPLRRLTGINRLQGLRRMVGVWSFVYAALHLTAYLVFDQLCYSLATCDFNTIWQDILKRPFIFVGQLAFVILFVLTLTSTAGWQRRLKKNWTRLHRLVYVAAIAGVIHFFWIQKSDYSEPIRWALWLAVLLALRAGWAIARRIGRGRAVVPASS